MKQLLNLALQNHAAPQSIVFAKGETSSSVFLKGVISADFGVSADSLRAAMEQAGGAPVSLYINSPGGDVFEGREMQGIIAGYSGKVTAIVQGVAASAATIVAMSASRIEIMRGSRYMIHNGMTIAFGNRHDLKARYDLLAGFDAELAAEYAAKSGKLTAQEAASLMDAETWFTAEQAVERGLVDAVIANTQNTAAAGTWNLSAYSNAPKEEPDPAAISAEIERMNRLNRSRLSALLQFQN